MSKPERKGMSREIYTYYYFWISMVIVKRNLKENKQTNKNPYATIFYTFNNNIFANNSIFAKLC